MNTALLLTAASVMALCAGGVSAAGLPRASFSGEARPYQHPKGAKVLWSRLSSDAGSGVNSQNFTSGDSSTFNDQGADDFVIPKGKTWRITKLDVPGAYFNGSGPATSENVTFYKDNGGMPGKPVRNGTFTNLDGAGGPNFSLLLPRKGLRLRAGHYWVSVIANMAFNSGGVWGWEVNNVQHGYQAMWQNPPGGFGVCPTWGTIEQCVYAPGPDFMFDLRGSSKRT